jgi:hypothetical protein
MVVGSVSKTKFTVHTVQHHISKTVRSEKNVPKPFDHPEIDLIPAKFWV